MYFRPREKWARRWQARVSAADARLAHLRGRISTGSLSEAESSRLTSRIAAVEARRDKMSAPLARYAAAKEARRAAASQRQADRAGEAAEDRAHRDAVEALREQQELAVERARLAEIEGVGAPIPGSSAVPADAPSGGGSVGLPGWLKLGAVGVAGFFLVKWMRRR